MIQSIETNEYGSYDEVAAIHKEKIRVIRLDNRIVRIKNIEKPNIFRRLRSPNNFLFITLLTYDN